MIRLISCSGKKSAVNVAANKTVGLPNPVQESTAEEMKKFLEQKSATVTGVFSCKGYNTYGPFKLIGGLNKHHPDEKDIQNAVQFYENLLK